MSDRAFFTTTPLPEDRLPAIIVTARGLGIELKGDRVRSFVMLWAKLSDLSEEGIDDTFMSLCDELRRIPAALGAEYQAYLFHESGRVLNEAISYERAEPCSSWTWVR